MQKHLSQLILIQLFFTLGPVPNFAKATNSCAEVLSGPTNVATQIFQKKHQELSTNLSQDEVTTLNQYSIIFLPGLFNLVHSKLGEVPFGEQSQWLKSQGVTSEVLLYPVDHPSSSFSLLENKLRSTPKKKIIISHSLGSILSMELLAAKPDLQNVVHGWISINGTLRGSPVASAFLSNFGWLMPNKLKSAVSHITIENRQSFYQENEPTLNNITTNTTALFANSWIHPEMPGANPSHLHRTGQWVREKGYTWNDGLVPNEHTYLGCQEQCVRISQADHSNALKDPKNFRVLLAMLLDRIKNQRIYRVNTSKEDEALVSPPGPL